MGKLYDFDVGSNKKNFYGKNMNLIPKFLLALKEIFQEQVGMIYKNSGHIYNFRGTFWYNTRDGLYGKSFRNNSE